MAARNNVLLALMVLVTGGCASGAPKGEFAELRRLPEGERVLAFNRLDEGKKIELFFQANQRHPPYSGLNDAFGRQGKDFMVRLRGELDVRGGVPEVLSFMVIVSDLKHQGKLSRSDLQDLRINDICKLAKPSRYCPELEAELLVP